MARSALDNLVTVLNRAIKADPEAMRELLLARVPCGQGLADDPTIQVRKETLDDESGPQYSLSALGVLSGIAGVHPDGFSRICAVFKTTCPNCGDVDEKAGEACPKKCGEVVGLGPLLGIKKTKELTDEVCG